MKLFRRLETMPVGAMCSRVLCWPDGVAVVITAVLPREGLWISTFSPNPFTTPQKQHTPLTYLYTNAFSGWFRTVLCCAPNTKTAMSSPSPSPSSDKECLLKLERIVPALVGMNAALQRTVTEQTLRVGALEEKGRAQGEVLGALGIVLPVGDEGEDAVQDRARHVAAKVATLLSNPKAAKGAGKRSASEAFAGGSSSGGGGGGGGGDVPKDIAALLKGMAESMDASTAASDARLSAQVTLASAALKAVSANFPQTSLEAPLARLNESVEVLLTTAAPLPAPKLRKSLAQLAAYSRG